MPLSHLLAATHSFWRRQNTFPGNVHKLLTLLIIQKKTRQPVLAQNLLLLLVQTAKCLDLLACFIASVGTCAKVIKQTAT